VLNKSCTLARYVSYSKKGYRYSEKTIVISANRINVGNVLFEVKVINDSPHWLRVEYKFNLVNFSRTWDFQTVEKDEKIDEENFKTQFEKIFCEYYRIVPCKPHPKDELEEFGIISKCNTGDLICNPRRTGCSDFGVVALVLENVIVPAGCNGYCFCKKPFSFSEQYCRKCASFRNNYRKSTFANNEVRNFTVISKSDDVVDESRLHKMNFSEIAKEFEKKYNSKDVFHTWLREQMALSLISPYARRYVNYPLTLRMGMTISIKGIKAFSGSYDNGKFKGIAILPSIRTTSKNVEQNSYFPGLQKVPILTASHVVNKKKVSYFGFVLSGDAMYSNQGVWPTSINKFRILLGGVDYDQTGQMDEIIKLLNDLHSKTLSFSSRKKLMFFKECIQKVKLKDCSTFTICKRITQFYLNVICLLESETYYFSLPYVYFFEDSTDYKDACAMIVGSLYFSFTNFDKLNIKYDCFGVLWDRESGVSKFFRDYSEKCLEELNTGYGWYMELPYKNNELLKVPFIRCCGHGKKGATSFLRNSFTGLEDSKKILVIPIFEEKKENERTEVIFGVASYFLIPKMYSIETSNIHYPKITRLTYDSVYVSKEKAMSEKLAGRLLSKRTIAGLDYYFLSQFDYPNELSKREIEIEEKIGVAKKDIHALQEYISLFSKLKNTLGAKRQATKVDRSIIIECKIKLFKWRYYIEQLKLKKDLGVEISVSKNCLPLDFVNLWIDDCEVYLFLYDLCEKWGLVFKPDFFFNQKRLESLFGVIRTIDGTHMNPRAEEYPKRLMKAMYRIVSKVENTHGNSDQGDISDFEDNILLDSDLSELINYSKREWEQKLKEKITNLSKTVFMSPSCLNEVEIKKNLENNIFRGYVLYRGGNILKNVIQSHKLTSDISKIIICHLKEKSKDLSIGEELFTPVSWFIAEFVVWENIFSWNFRLVLYRDSLLVFESSLASYILDVRKKDISNLWNDNICTVDPTLTFEKKGEEVFQKIVRQFCSQRFYEALGICGLRCEKYGISLRKNLKVNC